MARANRSQPGRSDPKIGPSDTSDTASDRPFDEKTDSDDAGTGERTTAGPLDPHAELHDERGVDRVVDADEAGLGSGLDEAEEAQLGVTDEELEKRELERRRALRRAKR